MVGTGDGPFELAEASGESGAAVGAPFVEGNYLAVLAPEQDEFIPEHLDVLGLASHFLGPDAGVPVLTEPDLGDVVKGAYLRCAVGLVLDIRDADGRNLSFSSCSYYHSA